MIKNATYRMLMHGTSLAAFVARQIDQLPGMVKVKPFSWKNKEEQARLMSLYDQEVAHLG